MIEPILQVRGLSKYFGGLAAVDDVSLDVEVGELHAVIGPNGAGKTTLINLLSGDLSPSAGSVLFRGIEMAHLAPERRSRLGVGRSYQKVNIFSCIQRVGKLPSRGTVARAPPAQLAARCDVLRQGLRKCAAGAFRCGLGKPSCVIAAALSHGEQRQLEIAMSLATDPQLLLLDEPLAGMGAEETLNMVELIGELTANHAILLVEHDMDAVFRLAQVLTVMVNGKILASGAAGGNPSEPGSAKRLSRWRRRVPMTDDSIIDARGLHSFYGASHILHGVDFSVRAGEAVGLMGRNGMGKTTLIRTLIGHVEPRRGEVKINGRVMTAAPPHLIARQGIAYVPEGRGIFPNLSVRENLIMAARVGPNGRRDWTYERVLETFPRLSERLSLGGQQLSGGEQQMLTIGRALLTNPDVLILDEATEGLAPLIAREIWRIIRAVRETAIAAIIVDKNYAAVSAITDRNVILVKGRVVFEGAVTELREKPEILRQHLGI